MFTISNGQLLDVIPYSTGVLFVERIEFESGEARLAYRSFDLRKNDYLPVTMGVYLFNKFGAAFNEISEKLNNCVLCDSTVLPDKRAIVLTPDSNCALFDKSGELVWKGQFTYHDSKVRSPWTYGDYFWCTVPEENSVVQFDASTLKVHIRIGNVDSSAFSAPATLSVYDDKVYVCNTGIGKIKTISLPNYSVSDYKSFDEPIYKYLRIDGYDVVWLKSGLYIL